MYIDATGLIESRDIKVLELESQLASFLMKDTLKSCAGTKPIAPTAVLGPFSVEYLRFDV